jgi:hypothetical protein
MKTLVFITVLVMVSEIALATREIPVQSERSLRKQFDSYVELLTKELSMVKEKDKKNRFALLSLTVGQMKTIRGEMESADSDDAKHMDMMISSLQALPSKKEFKKKNCPSYRATLPADLDPATPAAEFLSAICQ